MHYTIYRLVPRFSVLNMAATGAPGGFFTLHLLLQATNRSQFAPLVSININSFEINNQTYRTGFIWCLTDTTTAQSHCSRLHLRVSNKIIAEPFLLPFHPPCTNAVCECWSQSQDIRVQHREPRHERPWFTLPLPFAGARPRATCTSPVIRVVLPAAVDASV